MSKTQPTRMTQARLERVQALRREIAELSSNARALGNDAADPWRQTALRDVADTLTHAARSLNALLDRDATLPIQILPGLTIEEV